MDISMLIFFGARERTLEDWTEIVEKASPKFQLRYKALPVSQAGDRAVLDIVWSG